MDEPLYLLAQTVGQALLQQKAQIATVESCTGGWVAQALTAVPGSSEWFDCGRVTYSNASKLDLIEEHILITHGAVSEAVVAALTVGQLANCRADFALAISGIAGPGGGTTTKPVGTVCFGWLRRGENPQTTTTHFEGDREAVRRQSVFFALSEWLSRYANAPLSSRIQH